MVALFQRDQSVIVRHIGNVFADGELPASKSNMQKMHIAGTDKKAPNFALPRTANIYGSANKWPVDEGCECMNIGECSDLVYKDRHDYESRYSKF